MAKSKSIPAPLRPLKKMAMAAKGKLKKTDKPFKLAAVGDRINRGAERLIANQKSKRRRS